MKKRSDILFLLPSLCGFIAFSLVPFAYVIFYAVTESAFSHKFVGTANFAALIDSEFFRLALYNTLRFTALAVPVSMAFALAAALLISSFGKYIPFARTAVFMPVLLPSAVVVSVWLAYFSSAPPFESLLAIFLWKYTGLNVMLILTALCTVPRELYEAAQIDGAGASRRFIYVTLPYISPTLFFVFVLTIVNSLKIFRESSLLYGNYPDESVYMLQNYLNNHFEKLNYQNIGAAAVIFALGIYAVVAAMLVYERKRSAEIW